MSSTKDVSVTVQKMFPKLHDIIEKDGKLRQASIGEDDLYVIFRILKEDWVSLGAVLFLGFSHGDYYPLSAIANVLGTPDWKILRRLGILKYQGLVRSEQLGLPGDFFTVDKVLLLSAINDYKLKRITSPGQKNTANLTFLFDSLQIHPRIRKVSESLFKSGYYAPSIFEAFKFLNLFVKEKSGIQDVDGQSLMAHVFNEKQPILMLNGLRTPSEIDEQMGFKFILMGCMTGIRNPKAHDIVYQKDPYKTLEYLSLASLLTKRIDESKKKGAI